MRVQRLHWTLVLALVPALVQCRTPASGRAGVKDAAEAVAAAPSGTLVISGYLREAPDEKRWIHVRDGRIVRIARTAPDGAERAGARVIETEGFVVPGLMDLHNHLSYNVLPLWREAKGQFVNRFEWRSRAPAKAIYNKAVKFNLEPLTDALECAAARYAELQALTGGVTTVQGGSPTVRFANGTFVPCGQGFGPRNIEAKNELVAGKSAKSVIDIVSPYTLKFYKKEVEPRLGEVSYDTALEGAKGRAGYDPYVADFEAKVRQTLLKGLGDGSLLAAVAHLSEGRRDDPFTAAEYGYLKAFGLARRGMVVIHGVGMTSADFAHAAANGVHVVWSPFSNLLLYGQTLDVAAALAAGSELSLGSDWTPTGSKTLLHELKIARRYLDRAGIALTNDQLLDMVTVNPAKALGLEGEYGQVKEGYVADLAVFARGEARTAADAVLAADQQSVLLVAVAGRPLYGDKALLDGDGGSVETVRLGGAACGGMEKALALGPPDAAETQLAAALPTAPSLRTYAGLTEALRTALGGYRQRVESGTAPGSAQDLAEMPSPFACADDAYAKRVERFFEVEYTAAQDPAQRAALREQYGLTAPWSP